MRTRGPTFFREETPCVLGKSGQCQTFRTVRAVSELVWCSALVLKVLCNTESYPTVESSKCFRSVNEKLHISGGLGLSLAGIAMTSPAGMDFFQRLFPAHWLCVPECLFLLRICLSNYPTKWQEMASGGTGYVSMYLSHSQSRMIFDISCLS